MRWRITYRHVSGRGLNEPGVPLWTTGLTHEQILDTAYPVSVEVRMVGDSAIDPVVEAEVTWILPNGR